MPESLRRRGITVGLGGRLSRRPSADSTRKDRSRSHCLGGKPGSGPTHAAGSSAEIGGQDISESRHRPQLAGGLDAKLSSRAGKRQHTAAAYQSKRRFRLSGAVTGFPLAARPGGRSSHCLLRSRGTTREPIECPSRDGIGSGLRHIPRDRSPFAGFRPRTGGHHARRMENEGRAISSSGKPGFYT